MKTIVYSLKVIKGLFKNYCYLVVDSKTRDAVLIDPAWEITKIENQIVLSQAQLKSILLTHHHIDHINLADFMARRYNIPVRMSKTEIESYGFSCHNLIPIDNPHEFRLGAIKIQPLFTPGHTKGAICYWIGDALFTGDTLFIEGCGACFGQGSNPSEMFDSLCNLKKIIPTHTCVYPGHSYGQEPGKPFSYLLKYNIYLLLKKREEFIAFRMRKNQKGLLNFS